MTYRESGFNAGFVKDVRIRKDMPQTINQEAKEDANDPDT